MLDDLARAIRRVRRPGHTVTTVFVDLDRFKETNDTHGRVGDELLAAVAQRPRRVARPGDRAARPARDEFVIVCDDLASLGDAECVARRVSAIVAELFTLPSESGAVTASVGVAFSADADINPANQLHLADLATYERKVTAAAPTTPRIQTRLGSPCSRRRGRRVRPRPASPTPLLVEPTDPGRHRRDSERGTHQVVTA